MLTDFAIADSVVPHRQSEQVAPGWAAALELGFALSGNKTVLKQRLHCGPLTVQRPFYPEGGVCHVYLLHPPGGVVAGDSLSISANAGQGSQVLLTTPAAGKFYRSAGKQALQTVNLTVREQATLEWLPQESIVYEGACLDSRLHVDLEAGSTFIGWEVLVLGRPAAGEGFESGEMRLDWKIKKAGALFFMERLKLDAQAFAARWGLNGHSACGALYAYPAGLQHLAAVQTLIGERFGFGVTLIDDLLICRGLDHRADSLRNFFQQVWQAIRLDIVHLKPCPPRIWAT